MGDLVVARTSGVVMAQGRRHTLQRGVTVAHKDHDLVRKHPRLWKELTVHYPAPVPARAARVEQATAAPGELREVQPTPTPPEAPVRGEGPQRPPMSGAGSGVDAWRKYAAEVTGTPLEQWAGMSRDEIVRQLDAPA